MTKTRDYNNERATEYPADAMPDAGVIGGKGSATPYKGEAIHPPIKAAQGQGGAPGRELIPGKTRTVSADTTAERGDAFRFKTDGGQTFPGRP